MRIIVSLGFLGAIAIVWLWDSYWSVRGEHNNTVSRTVLDWSREWPIIPFGIGVTLGHLLWPNN